MRLLLTEANHCKHQYSKDGEDCAAARYRGKDGWRVGLTRLSVEALAGAASSERKDRGPLHCIYWLRCVNLPRAGPTKGFIDMAAKGR